MVSTYVSSRAPCTTLYVVLILVSFGLWLCTSCHVAQVILLKCHVGLMTVFLLLAVEALDSDCLCKDLGDELR